MIAPQTVMLGLASVFSALASEGKPLLWWAIEIGSAALLVTAATLFWTLRLQRLVRERTAELECKNRELERESADRRQALEALQLSDNRLRMAVEAAQLRTWHWDIAADRLELIGERTPEMGPPPRSSHAGLERFLAPIHHADIRAVRESLTRAVQSGEVLGVQFRVVLPDGSVRWNVARGCVVRDANAQVTALVGVVLDVTDRLRNEQELQQSEERYRELFENANDIIYTHDLAGNFTSTNKAAERVLGYSNDEVVRLNVRDLVAPEQLETAQQMIARKVAGDASRTE